jgi:uncharacterized membrane protein YqjE
LHRGLSRMVHQTTINEANGSPQAASKGLARDLSEFAHDVFTLAELQGQLFAADVQEFSQRVLVPGIALLIGVTLGLTCLPIALAGSALLLVQFFEISYAAGFLIMALIGAVLSSLLGIIGLWQVRKRLAVLARSQRELVRNLRWIKRVIERNRITRKKSIDTP